MTDVYPYDDGLGEFVNGNDDPLEPSSTYSGDDCNCDDQWRNFAYSSRSPRTMADIWTGDCYTRTEIYSSLPFHYYDTEPGDAFPSGERILTHFIVPVSHHNHMIALKLEPYSDWNMDRIRYDNLGYLITMPQWDCPFTVAHDPDPITDSGDCWANQDAWDEFKLTEWNDESFTDEFAHNYLMNITLQQVNATLKAGTRAIRKAKRITDRA